MTKKSELFGMKEVNKTIQMLLPSMDPHYFCPFLFQPWLSASFRK